MNYRFTEIVLIGLFSCTGAAFGTLAGGASDTVETKAHLHIEEPVLTESQRTKAIVELRAKHLGLPIAGFDIERVKGSFDEVHNGAKHGAADMLAPRNTPILAVENGTLVKLFLSKPGGITIYEADPSGKYVYYYAHLEKYADNLHDGDKVKKGQIIGYVGTSGNAPANTPHLHFSVGVGDALKKWWQTTDLDPYQIYK